MVRCTWYGILYCLNYFKRVLNECLGALGAAFCIVYELLQKSMNECVYAWVHLVWHVFSVHRHCFNTEHLSSPPVFSGVRVSRSLVLYVCFVDPKMDMVENYFSFNGP
jgi:hypothetical protein